MRVAARLVPAALFLAFALLFNSNLLSIRLAELGFLLEEASGAQRVLNSLAITGKYELLRNRLAQEEGPGESYELEARLQAFTAPTARPEEDAAGTAALGRAMTWFLNAVRFLQGKAAIHPELEDQTFRGLESAYLHERGRKYRSALEEYGRVLPGLRAGSDLRASTLLHVAFCHSMINEIDTARRILTGLVAEQRGKETGILAWKLLDFLDLLEERRRAVLARPATDLERARQAYLLVDYPAAVAMLTAYLESGRGDTDAAEALYYRARSYEEMGEVAKAEDDLWALSSLPAAGRWAVEAQRRRFLLGAIYGEDEQLAREALRYLAAHDERSFVEAIRPSADVLGTGSLAAWPVSPPTTAPRETFSTVAIAETISAPEPLQTVERTEASTPVEEPTPRLPVTAVGESTDAAPTREAARSRAPAPEPQAAEVRAPATATVPAPAVPAPAAAIPLPRPGPVVDQERIESLEAEKDSLLARLDQEKRVRRGYDRWSWLSLGTGVTTTGIMGYFLYQAFDAYARYQGASSFAEAKAAREATLRNRNIAVVSGAVGGSALAAAVVLWTRPPHPDRTRDAIDAVDTAIDKLRGGSR